MLYILGFMQILAILILQIFHVLKLSCKSLQVASLSEIREAYNQNLGKEVTEEE